MHMIKIFLSIILCASFVAVNGQTVISGSEIQDGLPEAMPANNGYQDNENIQQYNLNASAIYYNDGTVIFPTTDGLTKMDKDFHILWKIDSLKVVAQMAKLGSNLLITSRHFKVKDRKDNASIISAQLVDVKTGKLITEKILYDNNSPYSVTANICKDDDNNLQYVIIRKTGLAVVSEKTEVFYKLFSSTIETDILKLDNDCNITQQTSIETKLKSENMLFAGCTTNNKGDLYFFGQQSGKLLCEKINAGTLKSADILETTTNIGKFGVNSSILTMNKSNNNEADIVIKYKNDDKDFEVQTAKFDFEKKVAKSDELSLDKKLVKGITSGYTDRFELIGLGSYKNKIFTMLEFVSYDMVSTSTPKYYTGAILIRFFDENMAPGNMITLDKDFERLYQDCPVAGYKILNDRLIILANITKGPWYTEVNLNTLEVKKPVILPKTYVDAGVAIQGPATLWFDNTAILRYYTGRMQSHKIIMQKVEF